MPVRLSGMSSGLDTESLVKELVSGYTLKKEKLEKAQTTLQWKQDSWKEMNKKVYSFYSGKLSSARMSKSYGLKSASISNSTFAKVTASSGAVNGTQTLKVKKLATTGYLTGGVINAKNDDGTDKNITGSSKLSELLDKDSLDGGKISVKVDGKETDFEIGSETTVNQFVNKLKDAGLNANYDEANKRFFISSKASGSEHDFSITASNSQGMNALKSMGLFTVNDTDTAEYKEWASYAGNDEKINALKDEAYKKVEVKYEDVAKSYADKYNAANDKLNVIKEDDTWGGIDAAKEKLSKDKDEFAAKYEQYAKKDENGDVVKDKDGNIEYDTSKMEDSVKTEYQSEAAKMKALENKIKTYEDLEKTVNETSQYVNIEDGKAVADVTNSNVVKEVNDKNDASKAKISNDIDEKIAYSVDMVNQLSSGISGDSTAVRITGTDSEIELNGATFKNNTNDFNINGLTIQATAVTGDEGVSITTSTDVDGIYNNIKSLLKDYNDIIKSMDEAYNADSSKGYDPLTSEEKESMTDDEVEKWEKKIKDALLRKDSTLGNVSSAMKNVMASTFEINGEKLSLSSFGIKTKGYFGSSANEKGVYHIDGDSDDEYSAGNEDKLKAAIASDPDKVMQFFAKISDELYSTLGKKMATSSVSSAYTLYNDKQMTKEYDSYKTKISDMEDSISTWEDYYYKKFSKMESALSKLNQTQSSLGGYF